MATKGLNIVNFVAHICFCIPPFYIIALLTFKKKIWQVVLIVANVEASTNLFGMDLFNIFGFEIMQVSNIN